MRQLKSEVAPLATEMSARAQRTGARDVSMRFAHAALADAEGHPHCLEFDSCRTAPLRAIAALVVDRSC